MTLRYIYKRHKWGVWGVASVALMYLCLAILGTVSASSSGTADSYAHLDYTYQLSQGNLPAPYGYKYQAMKSEPIEKYSDQFHFTAAHPPLFYAIVAIPTKSLLEDGQWKKAVGVIRGFNILLGLLCLLAVSYFAWRIGDRYSEALAVLAPLSVLTTPFMTLTSDVYSDLLVVLCSTIAIGLGCIIVKFGPTKRRITLLVIACALGMLSKATFLAPMLIALGLVTVSLFIHKKKQSNLKTAGVALLIILLTLGSVAASSGWFYYKNYTQSGSWFRSIPKHPIEGREYKTLTKNLTSSEYYKVVPGSLLGMRKWTNKFPNNRDVSVLVSALVTILVATWLIRNRKKKNILGDVRTRWIIAGGLGCILLLYAQQLQHAVGWGAINPRYFLNGLLPFGLFFGFALAVYLKRLWPLVTALTGLLAYAYAYNIVWYSSGRYGTTISGNVIADLDILISKNGLSSVLLVISLVVVVASLISYSISIKKLGENQSR